MRILLVEDDKVLCSTVAMQLEQAGYQVDQCCRGDDALYYATEYPYDVIILDRMLPSLDGLSLLQAIRQKSIMTPVIITTALDGLGDRIDGLDAGADDYLVKPFAVEELLARIRAVTRRPGRTADTASLAVGNLSLDAVKHELTRNGAESETGHAIRPGIVAPGISDEKCGPDTSAKRHPLLCVGAGFRGGGRQSGQLHLFFTPALKIASWKCKDPDSPWSRLPAGGIP